MRQEGEGGERYSRAGRARGWAFLFTHTLPLPSLSMLLNAFFSAAERPTSASERPAWGWGAGALISRGKFFVQKN